jgi:hypothetical protein
MQQALQNEHYKKIWEMLYSKLLEGNETNQFPSNGLGDDCLIIVNEPNNEQFRVLNKNFGDQIVITNLEYKIINQDKYEDEKYSKRQILGRPINLEDIILLFPTNSTHFIKNVNSLLQIKIFGIDKVGCDFLQGVFDWQLGKPLHEQSPETWEKISKLIK